MKYLFRMCKFLKAVCVWNAIMAVAYGIWLTECVVITDVLLQIWTVAYLRIIMNSHVSCPAKDCDGAQLPQSNIVFKFKNIYWKFHWCMINCRKPVLILISELQLNLINTGWHKKTGTFEKPNKNWRNPKKKKKLLTEIETLQLAF